jgi:hypothetical protein
MPLTHQPDDPGAPARHVSTAERFARFAGRTALVTGGLAFAAWAATAASGSRVTALVAAAFIGFSFAAALAACAAHAFDGARP